MSDDLELAARLLTYLELCTVAQATLKRTGLDNIEDAMVSRDSLGSRQRGHQARLCAAENEGRVRQKRQQGDTPGVDCPC